MHVTSLDHVNIRTQNLEASASFYAEVLGLRIGAPASVPPTEACWLLDSNNNPIIHLRAHDTPSGNTGPFDHFALRCVGKTEVIGRLRALGVEHTIFERGTAHTVIITRDPHGVQLELNFFE